MLSVNLLGSFSVKRNGQPLEIPTHPAQSLFAWLILHPGVPQPRELLADRFWPDSTAANARSNLRHALWRLRQTLEPDHAAADTPGPYLHGDAAAVWFNHLAAYSLDTALLDTQRPAWSIDDLLAAAAAYQGELLPGFFDPWVVMERDRLAAVFERRMDQLLAELAAAARWEEVRHWAEHWIAKGSVPEPAYRALMQAHAAQGEMAQLVNTYRRCREALSAELSLAPSPLTDQLLAVLSAGAGLPSGGPVPPANPNYPASPTEFHRSATEFHRSATEFHRSATDFDRSLADIERRRADLYLQQVKRLNRLAAGLALGLAAAIGVAVGRRRGNG